MHVSNTGRTLYTAWAEGDDEWDDLDPVDQIRWQDLAKLVQELEQKAWSAGFDAAEVEFGKTPDDEAAQLYRQAHPEGP